MTSALNLDLAPTGDTNGESSQPLRDACMDLTKQGYTTIAIAVILGVGQQRVSEIRRSAGVKMENKPSLVVMPDAQRKAEPEPFAASCPHCGFRAGSKSGHPVGKLSGRPVCTLPPEMRAGEL